MGKRLAKRRDRKQTYTDEGEDQEVRGRRAERR
jgi:hypothetical protein